MHHLAQVYRNWINSQGLPGQPRLTYLYSDSVIQRLLEVWARQHLCTSCYRRDWLNSETVLKISYQKG